MFKKLFSIAIVLSASTSYAGNVPASGPCAPGHGCQPDRVSFQLERAFWDDSGYKMNILVDGNTVLTYDNSSVAELNALNGALSDMISDEKKVVFDYSYIKCADSDQSRNSCDNHRWFIGRQ